MNRAQKPRSVDDLRAAYADAEQRRAIADADMARIKPLLEAAELLESNGILFTHDAESSPPRPKEGGRKPRPRLSKREAEKVEGRDSQVMDAIIEHYADAEVFTVPQLDNLVEVNKRSIKRALDDLVERRIVKVIEEGYKRRPTKYRLRTKDEEYED